MTAYHGGKSKLGKQISQHINFVCQMLREEQGMTIKGYCEPFCGMAGVYQHIPALFEDSCKKLTYKAGDTNESVIKMWQRAQKGWKPPTISTQEEYDRLKDAAPSALKGYIGHQYSFGGQFLMGYAPKYGKTVDSSKASSRVQNISKILQDVKFTHGDYTQFSTLKGYVIYCDPPYENTSQRYKNTKDKYSFNTEDFFEWCRVMVRNKNVIFLSSYQAPKDFIEIMSSGHKLTGVIHSNADKKRTEKLYMMI